MSDTPTKIGPYAIERRLGVGGMAETFVALRKMQTIEQRVCLKRILPAYARDGEARRLFHREANISARLRHANLVQVLDVGEENGTPYLVMELVEGVDLDHVLESAPSRRLSPELVGYVLSEMAHALHEAHGGDGAHEGVVHRDLSPSNVLLSVSGEVKVADFGIAKALSGDKATQTKMRGKFAYMAPEQLDGGALDTRADLFALGVIGFEMLAGVRPFDADADARLVLLIAKNERKSIQELVPDAPRELLETIEALLAHDKQARPKTGHDVVERLAPMLPAAVVARRQLGKLVSAAYEAKLAAMARAPSGPSLGSDAALAATVMANQEAASAARTPSTRPAALAAGTPMVVSVPPPTAQEATTIRNAAPPVIESPARSRAPWIAAGLGVLGLGLVGLVGGIYVLTDGGAPAPGTVTDAPSASIVTPAVALGAASPIAPTTTAATTPIAAPPPSTALTRPPTSTAPAPTTTVAATHAGHAGHAPSPPPTTTAGVAHDPPPPSTTSTTSAMPAEPDAADEDTGHVSGERGRVHIIASPWGQIWIDGRFMGRAPIDATLRAGSHRIGAGFDQPTVTRTIRVRAGQDERVELEVDDP